jgi:hypothetical protein
MWISDVTGAVCPFLPGVEAKIGKNERRTKKYRSHVSSREESTNLKPRILCQRA